MRNGGHRSLPLSVMASLALATCFTVLACLLHSTVSEHKKKIIVKVPHLIKHIHHDVYKPVHVHKVHAKKLEHHHVDHEVERLPKWRPKKHHGGKHKARGSHSHLQPVLAHHDLQNHREGLASQRQGIEYGVAKARGQSQDYHDDHDYSQEADWSPENESGDMRGRHLSDGSRERRPKWEPVNVGEWFGKGKGEDGDDEWLISSEDLRELREDYGILGGKHNSQKVRNEKFMNPPTKPSVIGIQKDDWKPMMDFNGWKDVDELHKSYRGHNQDPINYSGDYENEGGEEEFRDERFLDNVQDQRKKSRKSKKSGKWSKQIDVREPTSEEYHENQQPNYSYAYPSAPNDQAQRYEHLQSQPRRKPQAHQTNRPELLPTPHTQQWPSHSHPPSPQPSSAPTSHPSSVVWSGHHLQTPQHTMWHVQQHNAESAVQVPVKPSSALPVHSPPLPLRQQIQQASAPAHRVTPSWPGSQKTPGVMQKWEQSVQMGDSDGPGSSYKVEVINYSKQ